MAFGLFHGVCDKYPRIWPWTVFATAAASVIVALRDAFAPDAWVFLDALPGADLGLGWLTVALVAAIAGVVHSVLRQRKPAEAKAE